MNNATSKGWDNTLLPVRIKVVLVSTVYGLQFVKELSLKRKFVYLKASTHRHVFY